MPTELLPDETRFIDDAAAYLENPSLLLRLAELIGKPFALLTHGIEKAAPALVNKAVNSALTSAMTIAIRTIPDSAASGEITIGDSVGDAGSSVGFWHNLSVGVTGTAGGFFGLLALPIELPITTTIMFRSIASIAKEFGEDLSDSRVRFQCMSVFYFGGPGKGDDDMDGAYLTARAGLEAAVANAARFAASRTAEELAEALQKRTAPFLLDLIAKIAGRFNVTVTDKLVAQALPIVGALGGASVNVAFMDHFNRVARYHFGIRSLERKYGIDFVQALYREAAKRAKDRKASE